MVTEELSIKPNDKINSGTQDAVPHPWEYPMSPTPDMIALANNVIRCIETTNKFIIEIEGPTGEQCDASCCNTL